MAVSFASLLLPILVAGVVLFVLSALFHMALPFHKKEILPLPNEDAVANALRSSNVAPGLYSLPYCSDMKAMKDPAFQEKFQRGPVAFVTVLQNRMPPMGKALFLTFLWELIVVSGLAGIAAHILPADAPRDHIQCLFGSGSFLIFALGGMMYYTWYGRPWKWFVLDIIESVVYAIATAMIFVWFWPTA